VKEKVPADGPAALADAARSALEARVDAATKAVEAQAIDAAAGVADDAARVAAERLEERRRAMEAAFAQATVRPGWDTPQTRK